VKLASLPIVHVHERRIADDLLDAADEGGARGKAARLEIYASKQEALDAVGLRK
jgi:hypothetical protein